MTTTVRFEQTVGDDNRYDRLASLTQRLVDGEARINAAAERGEDISGWEEFWLRLLHEYEELHNQLAEERLHQRSGIAA